MDGPNGHICTCNTAFFRGSDCSVHVSTPGVNLVTQLFISKADFTYSLHVQYLDAVANASSLPRSAVFVTAVTAAAGATHKFRQLSSSILVETALETPTVPASLSSSSLNQALLYSCPLCGSAAINFLDNVTVSCPAVYDKAGSSTEDIECPRVAEMIRQNICSRDVGCGLVICPGLSPEEVRTLCE